MPERIRVSSAEEDRRNEITTTLRHYRSRVAEYKACRDLLDELYPSGTQVLSDMPKAQTDSYEPERWAQRRWNHKERMEKSLQEMLGALETIESMTDVLRGDEKAVIVRRYFLGETMEQIAETMERSRAWCFETHRRAIEQLMRGDKGE